MSTVVSSDGTTIAFDRSGEGPPIILIGDGFQGRSDPKLVHLAALLAGERTVLTYDRGITATAGGSWNALEREIEDLDVLYRRGRWIGVRVRNVLRSRHCPSRRGPRPRDRDAGAVRAAVHVRRGPAGRADPVHLSADGGDRRRALRPADSPAAALWAVLPDAAPPSRARRMTSIPRPSLRCWSDWPV